MNKGISRELLCALLPHGIDLLVLDSVGSTNTYLRELASSGASANTIVAANSQTSGHGRLGRAFFSPPDTGVYFSILLRPEQTNDTAAIITVAAALAAAEACESVFAVPTEIKWVNDVLIYGRKAVGILAEAFSDAGFFVILGIGANIAPPPEGFPPELKNAGAFTGELLKGSRERFIAEAAVRLLGYLERGNTHELLTSYRARVKMNGKAVTVTSATERYDATVLGIDDEFRLIVSRCDGTTEFLSYGEVSLHNEN